MTAAALSFPDRPALEAWFAAHAATERELWVQIHKVATGTPSATWEDCVIAALAYGWIDGIKKSLGSDAYLQRLTPRKKGSIWSKRNCDHAERLIAQGRMTPAGRAQVEAAKADGRWSAAYAGPSTMEIPADFRAELAKRPVAAATFATLNKQNLYAIYYRLHSAKTPETRARRMEKLLATLEAGEKFH
ncbi:MAG: YdeI/OmpD-associated family protein [Rhodobacterales bacterium]|jgi:uncharacterized protein YdeI (YjbR/CyaY-like superfamily)|nr:YdeI/OmpD-associated family protein [Rhodobacterales bacterium]